MSMKKYYMQFKLNYKIYKNMIILLSNLHILHTVYVHI